MEGQIREQANATTSSTSLPANPRICGIRSQESCSALRARLMTRHAMARPVPGHELTRLLAAAYLRLLVEEVAKARTLAISVPNNFPIRLDVPRPTWPLVSGLDRESKP